MPYTIPFLALVTHSGWFPIAIIVVAIAISFALSLYID